MIRKLIKPTAAAAAIAALISGSVLTTVPAVAADAPAAQSARSQLPDFVNLVEQYGKGVVNISTVREARRVEGADPFGGLDERHAEIFRRFGFPMFPFGGPREEPEQRGTGSGFIISADGLILTNHHVVDGADKITVRLTDNREFSGKVLGSDAKTDIAVVKIEAKDLPVLKMGDSDKLKVGEWVAAIGSPFGLDNTVTAGIVSAKSRKLPSDQYVPFIQTDVAVNPGNSGGPLFNMDGEVVGINSQIFSTSGGFMGLSFAIPIDLALQIKDQLVKHGKVTRGRIGVMIQNITPELAESFGLKTPKGAIVAQIDKSGPAGQKSSAKASALGVTVRALNEEEKQQAETEGLLVVKSEGAARKAGIQSGDIIVNVNGIAMKKSTDLGNILEKSKTLRILIQRGGTRIFIPIRLK